MTFFLKKGPSTPNRGTFFNLRPLQKSLPRNSEKFTQSSPIPKATIDESSAIQGFECIKNAFPGLSNKSNLTLKDLSTDKVFQPSTFTRILKWKGKKMMITAQKYAPDDSEISYVSPEKGKHILTAKVYEIPQTDRTILIEVHPLQKISDALTIYQQGETLEEEMIFNNIGNENAVVIVRNGLVQEIALGPPSTTRCSILQDYSPKNTLSCECSFDEN